MFFGSFLNSNKFWLAIMCWYHYYYLSTIIVKSVSARQSYVEPDERTASEKKRQRSRQHYSNMPAEQRDIVLQRNRDYKKGKFISETSSPSSIMNMSSATIIGLSPSTTAMQSRSQNNSSGIVEINNYCFLDGIFEPTVAAANRG